MIVLWTLVAMLSSGHEQNKANLSATKVPAQKGDTEESKR